MINGSGSKVLNIVAAEGNSKQTLPISAAPSDQPRRLPQQSALFNSGILSSQPPPSASPNNPALVGVGNSDNGGTGGGAGGLEHLMMIGTDDFVFDHPISGTGSGLGSLSGSPSLKRRHVSSIMSSGGVGVLNSTSNSTKSSPLTGRRALKKGQLMMLMEEGLGVSIAGETQTEFDKQMHNSSSNNANNDSDNHKKLLPALNGLISDIGDGDVVGNNGIARQPLLGKDEFLGGRRRSSDVTSLTISTALLSGYPPNSNGNPNSSSSSGKQQQQQQQQQRGNRLPSFPGGLEMQMPSPSQQQEQQLPPSFYLESQRSSISSGNDGNILGGDNSKLMADDERNMSISDPQHYTNLPGGAGRRLSLDSTGSSSAMNGIMPPLNGQQLFTAPNTNGNQQQLLHLQQQPFPTMLPLVNLDMITNGGIIMSKDSAFYPGTHVLLPPSARPRRQSIPSPINTMLLQTVPEYEFRLSSSSSLKSPSKKRSSSGGGGNRRNSKKNRSSFQPTLDFEHFPFTPNIQSMFSPHSAIDSPLDFTQSQLVLPLPHSQHSPAPTNPATSLIEKLTLRSPLMMMNTSRFFSNGPTTNSIPQSPVWRPQEKSEHAALRLGYLTLHISTLAHRVRNITESEILAELEAEDREKIKLGKKLATITAAAIETATNSGSIDRRTPQQVAAMIGLGSELIDLKDEDAMLANTALVDFSCAIVENRVGVPLRGFVEQAINSVPARASGTPTNVVPSGPDMDRTTLKRLRNRISASRCRLKRKIWQRSLEKCLTALQAMALENEQCCRQLEKEIDALKDSKESS